MDRPILYLSNWASHRTPGQHGPGRRWHAMARPRRWELGAGGVPSITPDNVNLWLLRERQITFREYFIRFNIEVAHRLENGLLSPGHLGAIPLAGRARQAIPIAAGDTICCACARRDSPARQHPCHLEWAAPYLVRAGWDVMLYGRLLTQADGVRWADTGHRYCMAE